MLIRVKTRLDKNSGNWKGTVKTNGKSDQVSACDLDVSGMFAVPRSRTVEFVISTKKPKDDDYHEFVVERSVGMSMSYRAVNLEGWYACITAVTSKRLRAALRLKGASLAQTKRIYVWAY